MINIGIVKKEVIINKYVRVSSEIDINGLKKVLFFESDEYNDQFLCSEKADGFLVGLLILAMKMHSDINIESPVSERILYGLNTFLIPALIKMNPKLKSINIYAKNLSIENFNMYKGIATGVSGGVDSFFTILKNIDINIPNSHKISHFVLFNAGNFGLDYETSLMEFHKQIEYSLSISKSLNIPLIWLNSNLMEFLQFPFEQIHTFCNVASALILQNLIKTYYYSSGYNEFKLSFSDSSHYDLINEIALKTESFEMISFGGLISRFNKTKYIADFMSVNEQLNVCLESVDVRKEFNKINCSKCIKCIRTMTSLDVLGKIENYDKVFDLNTYFSNKSKYWGAIRYIRWRAKDEFALDIISNANTLHYHIPKMSYYWMVVKGLKNQINKIKLRRVNNKINIR